MRPDKQNTRQGIYRFVSGQTSVWAQGSVEQAGAGCHLAVRHRDRRLWSCLATPRGTSDTRCVRLFPCSTRCPSTKPRYTHPWSGHRETTRCSIRPTENRPDDTIAAVQPRDGPTMARPCAEPWHSWTETDPTAPKLDTLRALSSGQTPLHLGSAMAPSLRRKPQGFDKAMKSLSATTIQELGFYTSSGFHGKRERTTIAYLEPVCHGSCVQESARKRM